jgi:hypothetical protein
MDKTLPLSYPRRLQRLQVALVALLLLVGQAFAQVITIVETGGAAENSGWTFSGGVISASGTISIDASVVAAKLALGPLTISGTDILVNTSLEATSNTDLTFKATRNIIVKEGTTIDTNGGNLTFWADSDANRLGGVRIGTDNPGVGGVSCPNTTATPPTRIDSGGGNITIGGGANPAINFAHYDAGLGEACSTYYFAVGVFSATIDAGGGNILLRGSGGTVTIGKLHPVNIGGRYGSTTRLVTRDTGTITVEGDVSEATTTINNWATIIAGTLETVSGDITMRGKASGTLQSSRGFSMSGKAESVTGNILLQDTTPNTGAANYTGPFLPTASFVTGTAPGSYSNITLQADMFFFANEAGTNNLPAWTSGAVVVEPYGPSFVVGFTIGTAAGTRLDVSASDFRVG